MVLIINIYSKTNRRPMVNSIYIFFHFYIHFYIFFLNRLTSPQRRAWELLGASACPRDSNRACPSQPLRAACERTLAREDTNGSDGSRGLIVSQHIIKSRTAVSQDVQNRFPVQLAFAKFLSKIKGNFEGVLYP